MNLSMQICRATFALGLLAVAGAGAFAQNSTDADAQAPNVAHSRLEIASVTQAKQEPHWVVASVRVGAPQAETQEQASRVVAVHVRGVALPQG